MISAPVRILSLILFAAICNAAPRFANYIQDHMILQRAPQRAVLWGFGDARTLTTLTINGKVYTAISAVEPANAQNESIWSVTLDPVEDEGPFDIHVSQTLKNGTAVTITLHDVLFGDVWICSGQSNMQFTVNIMFNGSGEIANAGKYPKIRVFTASLNASAVPVEELIGIVENWSVASPQSINGPKSAYMSAVCWLYGRMIHQALDSRPIGLVATTWYGTPIEDWMSPEALHNCNATANEIVQIPSDDVSSLFDVPDNHSCLFNSMLYPFTRMVIYGAIWYQGEANAGNPTYACKLAKMIENWRQIWNQRTNGSTDLQFPFGVVQLSTLYNESTTVGVFPMLRWQQSFNVGYLPNDVVPKVFTAITLDLRDDPNGIHPRDKIDVGYRLSRAGLAIAYGQQVEFQGPIVQNVAYTTGGQTVSVTYGSVTSIELRNPNGFEICCNASECGDYVPWTPAPVTGKSGLTVTIQVPNECVGKQLYGLRYLWRTTPCPFKQAALYSGTDSNLPSPPYIKLF